jgi:hypothetical protein
MREESYPQVIMKIGTQNCVDQLQQKKINKKIRKMCLL